eukprot:scaffold63289_cov28-Tisochrysis_lutea.AAC.4
MAASMHVRMCSEPAMSLCSMARSLRSRASSASSHAFTLSAAEPSRTSCISLTRSSVARATRLRSRAIGHPSDHCTTMRITRKTMPGSAEMPIASHASVAHMTRQRGVLHMKWPNMAASSSRSRSIAMTLDTCSVGMATRAKH